MFLKLFLLFVTVPLIEMALLIAIGKEIGIVATIAIVVGTGAAGAALARQQGMRTLLRIQQAMAQGRLPGDELLDGLMILISGAMLLTPGLLTDAFGFALLMPRCRVVIKGWLKRRLEKRMMPEGTYTVEYWDVE